MSTPRARLALDCSFAGLSLALQDDEKTYHFTTEAARSSDILPTELQNLLAQAQLGATEISHVYATTGPGSFTGIRLGLAVAEALKLVHPQLVITGLSTLCSLAAQIVAEHAPPQAFTILLDAAGGQVYAQTFSPAGEPLTEALCTSESPTAGVVFAQASLMHPTATPIATLDARAILRLAENLAAHLPPQPVYIKPLTYKKAV